MAFKKGISGNPNGRPKGAGNKTTIELRKLISNFLDEQFYDLVKNYKKLEPKDRIKVYTDLLQYGLPKLQATSNEISFEKLSEDQLDEIINRLIQKYEAA